MAIAVRIMETEVSQQSGHTKCISLYVYRINENKNRSRYDEEIKEKK